MGGGACAADASAAGLASESPQQIAAALKSALAHASGFEMHFVLHKPSGATESATLIRGARGSLYIGAELAKNQPIKLVVLSHRAYFKASEPFWVSHGVSRGLAKILAPKWYRYPNSEARKLEKSLGSFSPSKLSQCMAPAQANPHVTVSSGTFHGQAVAILKNPGTKPGNARGTLAIAATGKAYPLHMVISAAPKSGGSKGPCGGSGTGSNFTGTATMSHWNSPPPIKAPAHPVALPSNG